MNESSRELLLRYLDGHASPEERRSAEDLLRADADARVFLRDVAEHAVAYADLHRLEEITGCPPPPPATADVAVLWRTRGFALAAGILIVATVLGAAGLLKNRRSAPPAPQRMAEVTKISGSTRFFGARQGGQTEGALSYRFALHSGDTVETRSCDAWVEVTLPDGSSLSLAGHSTLRLLDTEDGAPHVRLLQGHLWVNPSPRTRKSAFVVETPTLIALGHDGQFDLHTSPTESLLRVNSGTALVQNPSSHAADSLRLSSGHQVLRSLRDPGPMTSAPQPVPLQAWKSDLWKLPEITVGRWLPRDGEDIARLGAAPLLWPIPDREPLLLFAAALAAWRSTEHPLQLHAGSRFRFRGRTDRAQPVRFGFSAQRMRGVFAGKFEIDLPPDLLAPPGTVWDVEIPLSEFKPLHPQLAASPESLELTDVYALTIQIDAGLELHHIELVPPATPIPPPSVPSRQMQ